MGQKEHRGRIGRCCGPPYKRGGRKPILGARGAVNDAVMPITLPGWFMRVRGILETGV